MIPIRLELRNFMSYGEDVPPLDLSGLRTLCLSGDNGHGKSALLDAITWSLWGESRAGKNKHDELVRIGADEMSVTFTFEMDGQTYRVLRKRSKRASGNQWELQQATPDQGLGVGWRSLTGNNAAETEKAIQRLLRMSYDTFLNSAYLRQGQADQFVRQPPGKRKEILADILDLSRYDQLEAKARERARAAAAEATDLERDINGLDAELAHEPEYQQAVTALQAQIEELHARRETLRAEWDSLRDRRSLLDTQKQLADSLAQQRASLDAEIHDLTAELADLRAETERGRALLARRDDICRDFETLTQTRLQVEQLTQDLDKWHRGQQMLAAAEKEWMAAENAVQRRVERAVAEHEQARLRLQDYPKLQRDHDGLAPRVAAADALMGQRAEAQQRLADVGDTFHALREENARLDLQIKQWQERIEALDSQQGVCAVCNSSLPPDRVARTRAEYEASLRDAQEAGKRVRQEAGAIKKEMTALQAQVQSLEAQIKAATDDRVRLGQLQQRLLELEAVQSDLPNLQAVRAQAEKTLAAGDFAPEVRAKIEKYEHALQKLAHVEADHAAARERLATLADAERLHMQLDHAQAALTTAEGRLTRTEKHLRARQDARAALETQLAALAGVAAELALLETRLAQIREQEAARNAQERALTEQQIRHQQALDRCRALKAQRAETEKKLAAAKREQEVHEQLTRAFGKKGVQALIIENAIPELQEEANRLLERLTDGDMSLYFDTVREAKSKKTGPIETLDINVSDNLGTRPLEMYSGGEGFRAAFALRIALSKLLARRAGARLQTLIIDEGFGTQDGKGREKLVDALNAIQEDFEKIIVISHIDELKDAFASRIEVTKTPAGSQFTILEGAAG
ncbi:MAG: SMC family ATPase [Armatimonadetes bacterium]|nr:SMC family ATPase [Armatimonadota bacterium]